MYENAKEVGQVEARALKEASRIEVELGERLRQHGQAPVESLGRDCVAQAGPVTSMGLTGAVLNKAPSDARRALAGLMDRLDSDARAGERAKAARENLHALYLALPLEMPEAANRALEDLVRDSIQLRSVR